MVGFAGIVVHHDGGIRPSVHTEATATPQLRPTETVNDGFNFQVSLYHGFQTLVLFTTSVCLPKRG